LVFEGQVPVQAAEQGAAASVLVTTVEALVASFFDSVALTNKTTTKTMINILPITINSFFIFMSFSYVPSQKLKNNYFFMKRAGNKFIFIKNND
jgi:hypothetical protein